MGTTDPDTFGPADLVGAVWLTAQERLDMARADFAVKQAAVITAGDALAAASKHLNHAAEAYAAEARDRIALRIEVF